MTPIELRRKVLEKLQVIAAGESVHPSDGQLVQDKYEDLHEILLQDDLIEWVVSEDVPDAYQSIIVSMVAAECVSEFYVPQEVKVSILQEGKYDLPASIGGPSIAERRLRKLAAPGFNDEPAQPDYF